MQKTVGNVKENKSLWNLKGFLNFCHDCTIHTGTCLHGLLHLCTGTEIKEIRRKCMESAWIKLSTEWEKYITGQGHNRSEKDNWTYTSCHRNVYSKITSWYIIVGFNNNLDVIQPEMNYVLIHTTLNNEKRNVSSIPCPRISHSQTEQFLLPQKGKISSTITAKIHMKSLWE